MLIWLASYPRSGNTLLRILLNRVFALCTTSVYTPETPQETLDEPPGTTAAPYAFARRQLLREAAGHYLFDGPLDSFLSRARSAAEPVIVKTHDPPHDDSPAIYVVRDGRAAVVSYLHYLRDRGIDAAMQDVIRGRVGHGGSWSESLSAWQPMSRPRTILVRFEDVIAQPEAAIAAIARFLAIAPLNAWRNPNDQFRAADPTFFRGGSNEQNIAEMSPADRALFSKTHGAWMARLGYRGA